MSRYIDADALEDNMFVLADKMTEHGQKVMDEAIGLTRAMATADVQEVKHGHWIENETTYSTKVPQNCTCSVCGNRSIRPLGDFCRWCGAKMDEETVEEMTIGEWIEHVENKGAYECFHCGERAVIWQSDFMFEDYGYDGDGIIHECLCTNCGAVITYAIRLDEGED